MDRQEILLEVIMKEISKVERHLNIISTILIIWFLFWVISLILTILIS